MDFRTAAIIFFTLAGSFVLFNEVYYLPYMAATGYAEMVTKLKDPFRPVLVFLGAAADLGLLAGGLWAGSLMVNLYEGEQQSGLI